ncbi:hypothetical protein DM77_3432 [Burkholderia mallei]|nr:hypothetical protein DM77_3432 [Burkholderia mallei]
MSASGCGKEGGGAPAKPRVYKRAGEVARNAAAGEAGRINEKAPPERGF